MCDTVIGYSHNKHYMEGFCPHTSKPEQYFAYAGVSILGLAAEHERFIYPFKQHKYSNSQFPMTKFTFKVKREFAPFADR